MSKQSVFMTVEEFDQIIKGKGKIAKKVVEENGHLIYQREFVKRVTFDGLKQVYIGNAENREGVEYLYLNEKALAYFIEANPTLPGMSYQRSVENFCRIFNAYKEQIKGDEDFLLKLAVSVAISQSKPVGMWTGHFKPNNPVERFEKFKELVEGGLMAEAGGEVEKFKALPSAMMIFVVNARAHNDDLHWVIRHLIKRRDNGLGGKYLDPYQYIRYGKDWSYAHPDLHDPTKFDEWNKKWDIECFREDYTDNRYIKHWKVFQKMAVCGGISKSGSIFNQLLGYCSMPISQKGHCAYHYSRYDKDGNVIWHIGNNITHIQDSRNEQQEGILGYGVQKWCSDRSGSYIQLATAVLSDYSLYQKAVKLNILADVYKDDFLRHRGIYLETLKVIPTDLDALVNIINIDTANKSLESSHFIDLAKLIIENLKYYPLPMRDLLKLIEKRISPVDRLSFDLLRHNALVECTKVKNGVIVQADVCRQMANFLLQKQGIKIATFSFNGPNANKLVVNPLYIESGIKIQYSLDGGASFTLLEGNEVVLNQVTVKGILMQIIGLEEQTHKINIVRADAPSTKLIKKDDVKNVFTGKINNLQWAKEGSSNWIDYKKGDVFSGTQTIKVRYKANGTSLASGYLEYTFHENKDATK